MSSPEPRLLREWVGRCVELRRSMETRGGVTFEAGRVMLVYGHHRGCLHLEDAWGRRSTPGCTMAGPIIRKVARTEVRVLSSEELAARGLVPPMERRVSGQR